MEIRLAAFFGILLAGLGVGPSRAEPSSAAALDVRAEPVLRELAAHFQGLAAFRVRLEAETRFADPDPRPVFVSRATLAVKRPDKLALSVQNPLVGDLRITGDGTRRVAYLPALQRYTVTPARPGPAGPALDLGAASPIHLPLLGVLLEADPYAAARGAHAVAVLTGWPEYRALDFARIFDQMEKPAFVFDGCNILDHEQLTRIGLKVYHVGAPNGGT